METVGAAMMYFLPVEPLGNWNRAETPLRHRYVMLPMWICRGMIPETDEPLAARSAEIQRSFQKRTKGELFLLTDWNI
jgi:hypothetical protein